jgi:flagellar hook-associated protein 2
MSIKTDGVMSGIKTSALISELSAAMSRPKKLLETKVVNIAQRKNAYAELNTRMAAIKTSLEAIQDIDDFRDFSATTPDSADDYFTVTADGSSTAGTYSIQTTNLAESELWVLNTFSDNDSDAPINSGTFKITWTNTSTSSGFDNISIDVNSTNGNNTLSLLASAIDKKDGVTSYVMNDGSSYRLVIQGENTGKKYKFDVNFTQTATVTNGKALDPDSVQVSNQNAEDASISLNGITVTSTDNTFDDAIEGLTIKITDDMLSNSVNSINTTVALDTTKISEKIESFVTTYNDVIDFVKERSKFDSEKGIKGVFVGDSSARNILNRIRSVLTSQFSTLENANGETLDLDSLSLIGVTFASTNDGKLEFDSDDFVDALTDHQSDIEALFSDDADSFSSNMIDSLDEYIDPLTGIIEKLDENMTTQSAALQKQIDRWADRIESYEARLFKQFTAMEKMTGAMKTTGSFLTSFFAPDSK